MAEFLRNRWPIYSGFTGRFERNRHNDLASDLIEEIKRINVSIDEATIKRAYSETMENRIELISIHIESLISSEKIKQEELIMRLESLEHEYESYKASLNGCERLMAEIKNSKDFSETTRTNLKNEEKKQQNIQANLKDLQALQLEASKCYAELTWLKGNLADYYQGRESIRRIKDSLTIQREEMQKAKVNIEKQRQTLTDTSVKLKEIEQKIAKNTLRERSIISLLKKLPDVKAKQIEYEQLTKSIKRIDSSINKVKRHMVSLREEAKEIQVKLDELQKDYNTEASHHDKLNSFLANLEELVRSAECPLCGRIFSTIEEAKNIIGNKLSTVPLQLKNLTDQLNGLKKEKENKKIKLESSDSKIQDLEVERVQTSTSGTLAQEVVQGFYAECDSLGITSTEKDIDSCGKALEEAKKECVVADLNSEAARLKDLSSSLASGIEKEQIVVDDLQQKLTLNEQALSKLLSVSQELESNMVRRGFDPSALPKESQLTTEIPKVQKKLKNYEESINKIETELNSVESLAVDLRKSFKNTEEDVASKENQFRQYETACNRFISACRALDVDQNKPTESIHNAKQRALDKNKVLTKIEEKRKILQQVVSLSRLKKDIDNLAQILEEVKRKAKASSNKVLFVRKWNSKLEDLLDEIIGRQVDEVSTHLKWLEPTTQQLYQRLNLHPVFGSVKIRVDEKTHQLDFEAEASVPHTRLGDASISPTEFFSDAQINSLAIIVFLAGALRQQWSGLKTIIIDDPIQQMDEMNVYALLDLIRGLACRRQFIIFTCSRNFYRLALDKLTCLNKSKTGGFLAYRLEGVAPAELKVHCDTI